MSTEESTGIVVIIGPKLQQVVKAAVKLARAITVATVELGAHCVAFEEQEIYRALQAEADKQDPITKLLLAMEELKELDLLEIMPQPAEDMPPSPPPKIPRPPKCLGPINKANHTTSRPPRRARSSCYKRHR